MSPHPYAELFPEMDAASFEALKEDIRQNGQREIVRTYEGKILDGRHRWRACLELGIVCDTLPFAGDDPLGFVLSTNLHRRHLNESQRAMVAVQIANMERGDNQYASGSAQVRNLSQTQAASQLNVSERTVQNASKVKRDGAPELIAAVKAGEIAVKPAAQIAKLPQEEQTAIVAQGVAAVKARAKELREEAPPAPPPPVKPFRFPKHVVNLGKEIAEKARLQLMRIGDDDGQFVAAFEGIIAYAQKRLAERPKKWR